MPNDERRGAGWEEKEREEGKKVELLEVERGVKFHEWSELWG